MYEDEEEGVRMMLDGLSYQDIPIYGSKTLSSVIAIFQPGCTIFGNIELYLVMVNYIW